MDRGEFVIVGNNGRRLAVVAKQIAFCGVAAFFDGSFQRKQYPLDSAATDKLPLGQQNRAAIFIAIAERIAANNVFMQNMADSRLDFGKMFRRPECTQLMLLKHLQQALAAFVYVVGQ